MTSVLSYPTADPFSAPYTYPSIAGNAAASSTYHQTPTTTFSSPAMSSGSSRQNSIDRSRRQTGAGAATNEFGVVQGDAPSTSRNRMSLNMPLPLSPAEPIASTSNAHALSHTHTAASASTIPVNPTAQRARQRQSHNPGASHANLGASPPKPEQLSDEYVLHPSVYAYKQAHPRRQMMAFGPYVLLQTLGEGEFGKVKLGVHTEYGVEVAIKLIRRGSLDDEVMANKVEREIDVLKVGEVI
jgi:protein-serine/threonine kinase